MSDEKCVSLEIKNVKGDGRVVHIFPSTSIWTDRTIKGRERESERGESEREREGRRRSSEESQNKVEE